LASLSARIESARQVLLAARAQRVRPLLDDKVLADWNGLMIGALAAAGRAFNLPNYISAAKQAAVLSEKR